MAPIEGNSVIIVMGLQDGVTEMLLYCPKKCHEFLTTLGNVEKSTEFQKLTNSINQLIYTTRLPWIFVLTLAWLVAVLYLAFGAIWPLDWTHMRSHWLRGGEHQWQCMWYKMMTGRKGVDLMEYFGKN
eukprot:XP_001609451.1 variant erythrocyte surface antigen-1, alpha subunit [Babesia bovis T2Bo]